MLSQVKDFSNAIAAHTQVHDLSATQPSLKTSLENINAQKIRLPWTTWVMPFIIFHVAAFISAQFKTPLGGLLLYLPVPISIILVQWWGPRILPALLLAAISRTLWLKGIQENTFVTLINSTHVPVTALLSWWLFLVVAKGKCWLPDKENVIKFLVCGILIPITINALYEFVLHDSPNSVAETIFFIWTADFASSCALALPALFFLTPIMENLRLTTQTGSRIVSLPDAYKFVRYGLAEITSLAFALILLSSLLPLEKYWFVLGVVVTLIAIRFGFGPALMANLLVFILSYVKPFIFTESVVAWALKEGGMLEIHQGMCLLGLTASITGRVVSDLRSTEKKLSRQYDELRQAHGELDRFVYSTSHDLSAPLKSIRGLINISRIEKDEREKAAHLGRIEKSAIKLEAFIQEIQEYARNSRLEVKPEVLSLKELISETLENLQYVANFNRIKFYPNDLQVMHIVGDRMRMKIILNNLISNAIQYHRLDSTAKPHIRIHSEVNHDHILIHVEDNGEGIREDLIDHIFKMFYRGSPNSTGSGLGLYIAKEAAEKMGGKISVRSVYGLGSMFTVHIPNKSSVQELY
jgi:two-component system, sensor histidine kinase